MLGLLIFLAIVGAVTVIAGLALLGMYLYNDIVILLKTNKEKQQLEIMRRVRSFTDKHFPPQITVEPYEEEADDCCTCEKENEAEPDECIEEEQDDEDEVEESTETAEKEVDSIEQVDTSSCAIDSSDNDIVPDGNDIDGDETIRDCVISADEPEELVDVNYIDPELAAVIPEEVESEPEEAIEEAPIEEVKEEKAVPVVEKSVETDLEIARKIFTPIRLN